MTAARTCFHRMLIMAALLVGMAFFARLALGDEPDKPHATLNCAHCHVPHSAAGDNAQVPLWNPARTDTDLSGNYTSPSINAQVGTVDGASVLCLSCHDGSFSMDAHATFGPGAGQGMGTLEASHPISFVYDTALATADGALVDPTTLAPDVLDGQSKMQCTSCHDVHQQAVDQNKLLRWSSFDPDGEDNSTGFCRNCHLK